jgi:hypothetical protein
MKTVDNIQPIREPSDDQNRQQKNSARQLEKPVDYPDIRVLYASSQPLETGNGGEGCQ